MKKKKESYFKIEIVGVNGESKTTIVGDSRHVMFGLSSLIMSLINNGIDTPEICHAVSFAFENFEDYGNNSAVKEMESEDEKWVR